MRKQFIKIFINCHYEVNISKFYIWNLVESGWESTAKADTLLVNVNELWPRKGHMYMSERGQSNIRQKIFNVEKENYYNWGYFITKIDNLWGEVENWYLGCIFGLIFKLNKYRQNLLTNFRSAFIFFYSKGKQQEIRWRANTGS